MNATISAPSKRKLNQSLEVSSHKAAREMLQLVTFRIGHISLGIDIAHVQEINRLTEVTPVPGSLSRIHGVVNLRGEVVTVIDAHQILQLPCPASMARARNLILNMDGERLGILVDEISDILTLERSELSTTPSNLRSVDRKFIDAVYLRENELVVVLNPHGLLDAINDSARN
jgi:purine-binding chemotaxis protein CheW